MEDAKWTKLLVLRKSSEKCLASLDSMHLTLASSLWLLDQAVRKLHLVSGPAREVVGDNSYVSDSSLMNNYHRARVMIDVIGKPVQILNF